MSEASANAAVIGATILTLSFLVPQIIKLVRTRDSQGVSATWPALGFVSNVGWFVYVIERELWASMLAPFGTFIGYAITLWALGRTGRRLAGAYARAFVWGVFLTVITVLIGWTALGVALGLSIGVMLSPALWTAYRTHDPSGISPGTWWIGVLEAALWGYYGLYHSDAGIITFGVVAVTASSLMLLRYYSTRTLEPAVS